MTALRRCVPPALLLLRLTLGILLLWAGTVKASEPALFAQTVRAYEVLPLPLINPFAICVPWVEITAGLCLVIGLWTRGSALTSLLLLLAFEVALGVNLYRGVNFSCGCFALDGSGGSLRVAMLRNVLLISAAVLLVLVRRVPFSLDLLLDRPSPQRDRQ